jgi:hypothetical protein
MRTGRLTITRPLAATLLTASALAVAACGDDGGGAASAADRQRDARDAALKYAQCMREQGVDMPDPTFEGDRTNQTGPDEDLPPAKLREAEQACGKYRKEDDGPRLSDEQQQEFKDAALANARCMREQGIENFPDPTFPDDGEAMIEAPEGAFDPDDPDFKEAQEACGDTMPKPPSEGSAP